MKAQVIALVSVQSLSVSSTLWGPLELSRYIRAWQTTGLAAPEYLLTQFELAGMWMLWLMFQIFLALFIRELVRARCREERKEGD